MTRHTPFVHLSDEELLRVVRTKPDVTDLEMELMHRLEWATDMLKYDDGGEGPDLKDLKEWM